MQRALRFGPEVWFPVRDGDRRLRPFYNRHYSSRGGDSPLIAGPGEKLVLLTHALDAVFVWRKFEDACRIAGDVNCAVFRNEGPQRSSDLILAAEEFAGVRWPTGRGLALYTYVDPAAVRNPNPGYCFRCAGWTRKGMTPGGHGRPRVLVLEKTI